MDIEVITLKERIGKELTTLGGHVGVAILDTRTRKEIRINAEEKFPAASVIKLAILIEMLYQIQDGTLDFSRKITINNGMSRVSKPSFSSGALCFIESPIVLTISELATLMMIVSDNVAADVLIEHLGLREINNRLKALGLTNTCLNSNFFDPELLSADSINYTTAQDMMKLLTYIYYHKVPYADFSLSLLRQQRFRHGLPFLLPNDAVVFNKTGTLFCHDGHAIVNDIGIVMLNQHGIIVSFLSNEQTEFYKAALTIAKISKILYEEGLKSE